MKLKKIIILLMTMIIILTNFIGINISMAVTDNQVLTVKKGTEYGATIKEGNATLRYVRTYYEGNGGIYPVYCLDKSKPGVSELPGITEYQVEVSEKITDERLWRIIMNSFPYVDAFEMGCDTPAQAFIATKEAISYILYDKNIDEYSAINEDGRIILTAIKTLIQIANDETIKPYSNEIDILPVDEWKLEKVNGKVYLSRIFKIENDYLTGKYTVGLRGYIPKGTLVVNSNNKQTLNFNKTENFKVLIPAEKVNKEDTITIYVKSEVTTYPIYNGVPLNKEYQNYLITGIRNEIGKGEKAIPYSPIGGELVINKIDATSQEKLSGAVFNIYDSNNIALYQNLRTDENGQIKIYNLLTDTYYIEEVKAPEGYTKIDRLLDIKVIEGSISNLNINNSKPEIKEEEKHNITVEIVETNKENNTIIENEYYKQETNNNTENNIEINNKYIDIINNNNKTNTIKNNEIITTINNNNNSNNEMTNTNIINENNDIINANIVNEKNMQAVNNITNVKKLPKTGM